MKHGRGGWWMKDWWLFWAGKMRFVDQNVLLTLINPQFWGILPYLDHWSFVNDFVHSALY